MAFPRVAAPLVVPKCAGLYDTKQGDKHEEHLHLEEESGHEVHAAFHGLPTAHWTLPLVLYNQRRRGRAESTVIYVVKKASQEPLLKMSLSMQWKLVFLGFSWWVSCVPWTASLHCACL